MPPLGPRSTTFRQRLGRFTSRLAYAALVVMLAFGGAVLIGLLPVNRNFAEAEDGIEITVYVDSAHSEIIVPLTTNLRDWRPWFSPSDFRGVTGNETHVAFGWGDREFFLNTPRWEDVRVDLTLCSMLWPTSTVMHVSLMNPPPSDAFYRQVTIEPAAYQRMCDFIESSFVLDGSTQLGGVHPRLIPGWSYGMRDAFYDAVGTYSVLYTCNAWAGDALEVAGVRTGCWTPFPMGILQLDE
jgi:uncharacterized protein (TIGR02117 family)